MELRIRSKRGVELPFEWIFAMIAGGVILFIAIYAAANFVNIGNRAVHSEIAAEFLALLDPYETGLASGKSAEINFKFDSRIIFDSCEPKEGYFGRQTLAFTQKTYNKWGKTGESVPIDNKYVFAENRLEGKNFFVFSKPFFMGFKVSDLIIISSKKYCFYQAPDEIKDGIISLNLKNINFSEESCSGIKVCFGRLSLNEAAGCRILVMPNSDGNYKSGQILKYDENGKHIEYEDIYYANSLVYAGIFSSKELYECNVQRLMSKFSELGSVYLGKANVVAIKGCGGNSRLGSKLTIAIEAARSAKDSSDLASLADLIKDIETINRAEKEGCQLYEGE